MKEYEGKKENTVEIVINGYQEGLSNEMISKLTKLSIQEVEEILKNALHQGNEE